MDFNNKHVVLIILVIIIFVFVYNYDVYVIGKGESLCKPIYVVKRELDPEIIKELSESEKVVINEAFTTDYFGNIDLDSSPDNEYQLPPKSLLSFHVPEIKDPNKTSIMDSVIKVLSYIPTNIKEPEVKEMLEYFGLIFQTSDSLEAFYKSVSSSTKIKSSPYNTKYSQLILFLIGKFNNDYALYKSKCNSQKSSSNPTQQYLNDSSSCNKQNAGNNNNDVDMNNNDNNSNNNNGNDSNNNNGNDSNNNNNNNNDNNSKNIPFDENTGDYSTMEDDIISEIENELDDNLNNKKSKKNNKVRFSENEGQKPISKRNKSGNRNRKGKINNSRRDDDDDDDYGSSDRNTSPENEIFKRRKSKSKDPKNCVYKCNSKESFNNANLDTLESYNSTEYESFGLF
jgi:hypothetical protein